MKEKINVTKVLIATGLIVGGGVIFAAGILLSDPITSAVGGGTIYLTRLLG